MICGVCCLVTCLWWAIISITSWLLVPLPHNVSPSLNQRCHYGQSEDTPRPHNEPIIRLPVTISAPFSQLPLPLTSSGRAADKSCSVFRSIVILHFQFASFIHLCKLMILSFPTPRWFCEKKGFNSNKSHVFNCSKGLAFSKIIRIL